MQPLDAQLNAMEMDVDPASGGCCQPDARVTPEKKVTVVDVDVVTKSVPGVGAFTSSPRSRGKGRGARAKNTFLKNKQSLQPRRGPLYTGQKF